MANIIGKIKTVSEKILDATVGQVSIQDLFVFGGLFFLGYGLSMFRPWVGVSVSGALLMALGLGWLTRGSQK